MHLGGVVEVEVFTQVELSRLPWILLLLSLEEVVVAGDALVGMREGIGELCA